MGEAEDRAFVEKVRTLGVIVKSKPQLPYGKNAPGVLIPGENGRRAIAVPSFGALEQEEIDYVVEVAKAQEDDRIRKDDHKSEQKQALENIAMVARSAPSGKRAEAVKQVIKEGLR